MNQRRRLMGAGEGFARELLDTWRAYFIGRRMFGKPAFPDNRWNSHDLIYTDPRTQQLHSRPYYAPEGDGEKLVYVFTNWVRVELSNFRPRAGSKPQISFGKGELVDEKVISVGEIEIVNDSDGPMNRTRDVTDRTSAQEREQDNVQVTARTSIRQMVSYGGELYGMGGETELTAELEAAVGRENERIRGEGTDDRGEDAYIILPRHVATETRTRKVGRFRQAVTIAGELDWTTTLISDGDYRAIWTDRAELRDCLLGVGLVRPNGPQNFAGLVAQLAWADMAKRLDPRYDLHGDPWNTPGAGKLHHLCGPLNQTIETVREYDRAEKIHKVYRQQPLAARAA